jgi:hypothetical protein
LIRKLLVEEAGTFDLKELKGGGKFLIREVFKDIEKMLETSVKRLRTAGKLGINNDILNKRLEVQKAIE